MLDEEQRLELKHDLETLLVELRAQIEGTRAGAAPVDLGEPIGRLSRMEAIQQQNMSKANLGAAQQRLALSQSAIGRLADGDFGECVACGEEIAFARLKARPESPFCLECQGRRESATQG